MISVLDRSVSSSADVEVGRRRIRALDHRRGRRPDTAPSFDDRRRRRSETARSPWTPTSTSAEDGSNPSVADLDIDPRRLQSLGGRPRHRPRTARSLLPPTSASAPSGIDLPRATRGPQAPLGAHVHTRNARSPTSSPLASRPSTKYGASAASPSGSVTEKIRAVRLSPSRRTVSSANTRFMNRSSAR